VIDGQFHRFEGTEAEGLPDDRPDLLLSFSAAPLEIP
jgi:hypothetical protein